jgi:hypothetical protein
MVPFVVQKQASSQTSNSKALEKKSPHDEYRIEKVSPNSSIKIVYIGNFIPQKAQKSFRR